MRILEERKDYTLYYEKFRCEINKKVVLCVILDNKNIEYYEYHYLKEFDNIEKLLKTMSNKLIKRYKNRSKINAIYS